MIRLEPLAPAEPGAETVGPAIGDDDERPRSPGVRRRVTWAAVLLVLVASIALVVVAVLRARGMAELRRATERFESTVGPLRFEASAPPAVPDEDNAALPILEALEALGDDGEPETIRETVALRRMSRRPSAEWSEDERRLAREWVGAARESGVLARLDEAARRRSSAFPLDYTEGPMMEIPPIVQVRAAASLLHARAALASWDGEPEEAVAAVRALAALSRALEGEGPLYLQLVGHDVEETQYRAIRDVLAEGGPGTADPEVLRALRETTAERPRVERLRRALGVEGTLVHGARPGGPHARSVVASRPWFDQLHHRWLGHRRVAAGLDYYSNVIEAAPELLEEEEAEWPPAPDRTRTDLPVLFLGPSLRTMRETEALRRQVRFDLEATLGGDADGDPDHAGDRG